jgi:hypothetical protein
VRLSAYVRQHGVDPFTFDDFLFVGEQVAKDPGRLILVGGQAIEAWGVFFDVLAPTGERFPLTEDTDWLGGPKDAQWLCDLLGQDATELTIAGFDDASPSSALAYLKRPGGRVLLMDFLRCIIGPDNAEVQRTAVPVRVGGHEIHILHPVLCLHSRLANLKGIPAKRKGNGPLQAIWAIEIVGAFLRKTLELHGPKRAINAIHQVAELAEFKAGRYCYLKFDIDPLTAVDPEIIAQIGGDFAEKDWPNTTARIARKRARWKSASARKATAENDGAPKDAIDPRQSQGPER